jgi:exosortase H (IPTLxxWG-CTERM-specific)
MVDPQRKRLLLRFTIGFLAYVLLFSILIRVDEALFDGAAAAKLNQGVAGAASSILKLLGAAAQRDGSTIFYRSSSFQIVPECTGVEVIGLFVAGVLAFPSRWLQRGKGLLLGVPILIGLNLVRILTLVYAGSRSQKVLEYGHLYVWPVIVLVVTVGIWLDWAKKASRDERLLA